MKCCINYEASVYVDAQTKIPNVKEPLEFEDGKAYLVKKDTLSGTMWFSYDEGNMSNMFPIDAETVRNIISLNRKGIKAKDTKESEHKSEFVSAVGDDSISRFDESKKKKKKKKRVSHGEKGK